MKKSRLLYLNQDQMNLKQSRKTLNASPGGLDQSVVNYLYRHFPAKPRVQVEHMHVVGLLAAIVSLYKGLKDNYIYIPENYTGYEI